MVNSLKGLIDRNRTHRNLLWHFFVKNIRKAVLKAPLNQRGISRSVLSFPLVNLREVDAKRCVAAVVVYLSNWSRPVGVSRDVRTVNIAFVQRT